MPAQMRIDQVTPGMGVAGRSRHDLVADEIITLTATSPAPGVGVSYSWEIIDKRGSNAVLSATTGTSVSIGIDSEIVSPCAFLVEMTANDNGVITRTRRIASVRTTVAGLRTPLFPETAPEANKFDLNNPDLSTDNATYVDRSGLGVEEQNWSGWAEWAWEIVLAIEAASSSSSGPAGGDLSGTYPNPTVARLRGRTVSTDAPAEEDVLMWDGSAWVPTELPPGGALFVFRPGGVADDNVFTGWADLYAEASLIEGPVTISVDDSLGNAEIPAGTYSFQDWTICGSFVGVNQTNLMILTGVTITGEFTLRRIYVTLDNGATSPITVDAAQMTYELIDANIDGDGTNGLFVVSALGKMDIIARGTSKIGSTAIETSSTTRVDLYDRAQLQADAVVGSSSLIVRRLGIDVRFGLQSGFGGTITVTTPKEEMNGPLNASQLGTTELHIGSIYLPEGTRILQESSAMLGAEDPADTGNLLLRRFTGGDLIATWTSTGTLDDTPLGVNTTINNSDWYDLYLVADAADETAIIKGLRLLTVKE